jgi:hypothetical protein
MPSADVSIAFELKLSRAQLGEVWAAESDADATALLARIAQIEDMDEEPRKAIWVDFMYQQLAFAKEQSLIAPKALAFFDVVLKTHAYAVEAMVSRQEAFTFFADQLLSATKALPVADRFSVLEVQRLSEHMQRAYLQNLKLHQLVFTQQQTTRESEAQLFLQTPAKPPPLAEAGDEPPAPPASAPEADPEAAAVPEAAAPEAAPPADAAAPAAAPAAPADDGLGNAELTAALNKALNLQVEALQAQMTAEYGAQEQALLDRIAKLEK